MASVGQRGRKEKYVQQIRKKDEKMLKAFRACHYLSRDMLKEKLGMSDHRVGNFEKDGYIEKIAFFDAKQNQVIDVFRLTADGRNFIEKSLNLTDCYKSNSISHDFQLAGKYMNCSEAERETWKTETELRNNYKEMIDNLLENDRKEYDRLQEYLQQNEISSIDGSYISDETGMEISTEVITDSYGREEIEAKVTFCHIMNIQQ